MTYKKLLSIFYDTNSLRSKLSSSYNLLHVIVHHIGAREKIYQGGIAEIARKILLHKMFMIWSTINILPLLFTYFVICLRNEKNLIMILKTVTFLCKAISTYWYTTNQGIQVHCK